ncbi:MAG: formylglycine-generating enzyme family protein [Acidobacteria bacterium]|nr:MAG: formylglycine-generating enzyme family protein [Acidobacteriota bacterium]
MTKHALTMFLFLATFPTDKIWVEPATNMRFVRISAGTFLMGTPETEPQRNRDETLHQVTIKSEFYLGVTEVTQREWAIVMANNPSHFKSCGPECPVESVSFYDIRAFIQKLESKNPGVRFRLPTEAEWEYACRAGTKTPFATGENITTDQSNYDGRYPYAGFPKGLFRGKPIPGQSFAPNSWGLYDMEGNVWEWCDDWYDTSHSLKIIRGGSWYFGADSARCGLRYTHRPQDSGFSLGFRLVASLVAQS